MNFLIQRGRTLVFLLEVNCQAEKHLLKGSKLLCRKRETTSTEQRTTRTVLFHRTPKLHEREGNTVRALQVLVFSRKNIRAFDPVAADSLHFCSWILSGSSFLLKLFPDLCTCRIHFVLHYKLPRCMTILHTFCIYPVYNMWILTIWTLNRWFLEYSGSLLKRKRSFHAKFQHLITAAMRVPMFKKRKRTFFLTVREAYFTLLFHGEKKKKMVDLCLKWKNKPVGRDYI